MKIKSISEIVIPGVNPRGEKDQVEAVIDSVYRNEEAFSELLNATLAVICDGVNERDA